MKFKTMGDRSSPKHKAMCGCTRKAARLPSSHAPHQCIMVGAASSPASPAAHSGLCHSSIPHSTAQARCTSGTTSKATQMLATSLAWESSSLFPSPVDKRGNQGWLAALHVSTECAPGPLMSTAHVSARTSPQASLQIVHF